MTGSESLIAARREMPLAELLATVPPGWHPEPWTWEDEERDIRSRLCLCCGKVGHHQETIEARIRETGLTDGVCIGEDGRLHDGHHRVIAAIALGIEAIPLETRAEADARWVRDHGPVRWELRRFGDSRPGGHWDWIQKVRQEARDFVAWEVESACAVRQDGEVPPLRQCPHGVNVGSLDDYGVPADKIVTSSYCEICKRAWELRGHDGRPTTEDIKRAEDELGKR